MTQTRMEFAYTTLRDKVWEGNLAPGQRLVNRTLGKELGVSTVTIREALHRLTSEGLLEHIPNAGVYVRQLGRKDMVDLLLLRSNLDCFAVEQVVGKIAEYHLSLLEAICNEWRGMVDKMRRLPDRRITGELLTRWLDLDVRFHSVLIEVADNSWLTKVIDDLNLNTRAMRNKLKSPTNLAGQEEPFVTFSEAAQTYRHHASITKAIKKNDVKATLHYMKIHGNASLNYLLRQVDDDLSPTLE